MIEQGLQLVAFTLLVTAAVCLLIPAVQTTASAARPISC